MQNKFSARSELAAALWSLRRTFYVTGAFSFVINMVLLVQALYMLQIYDRVLMSRNEYTLLMLTLLALGLYALMDLLARIPHPDEAAIREALEGNLCRCTGYLNIVEAIGAAAQG